MIKPLQLGDGIMTDETKEFASIEDATPTTAIPSETDATTATTLGEHPDCSLNTG